MSSKVEYCLQRALECDPMAESAVIEGEALKLLASRWRVLAADEHAYAVILHRARERNARLAESYDRSQGGA
jgi:hypothetical protein